MSGDWPEALAEAAAGRSVDMAVLARLDFASGVERYWLGAGPLAAVDPMAGTALRTWSGLGELVSMDGLEQPMGDQAPMATFTLSGVDAFLIQETLSASQEVKGRDITIFLQFFTEGNLRRLDKPLAVYGGLMDVMSVRMTGPGKASITVTAENPLLRRTSALAGSLMDQTVLWPDDRGLDRVPQLPTKRPWWPVIEPE